MKSQAIRQVRIISGRWRGSRLPIPLLDGLRPTPDRVRETLFNWLGPGCRGANVLDCFSGSGALGLEALSRGAKHLTMIEKDQQACDNLRQQVERLNDRELSVGVDIRQGNVIDVIPLLQHQYGIVFIDPPYALSGMRNQVIGDLVKYDRLVDRAQIYIEWPIGESYELPLDSLYWLKQKKAGKVYYGLAECRLSR